MSQQPRQDNIDRDQSEGFSPVESLSQQPSPETSRSITERARSSLHELRQALPPSIIPRQYLSPTRNIIRTVDYNEPADWFDAKKDDYPPDYFTRKAYTGGRIPKRFEDTISTEELKRMRNSGEYIEKMSYNGSVEYYSAIMGGIPPENNWIINNATYFGKSFRTNIVLAIALRELEYRLKSFSAGRNMSPNFHTLSSYNRSKEKHHGLGMAIDFDPRENWLAKPSETSWNIPLAMVQEAQKIGFDWGMYYFEGRPNRDTDAMHFAFRGRIPDLMRNLKSAEAIEMAKNFIVPGTNQKLYDFDDSEYERFAESRRRSSARRVDIRELEETEIISKISDKYKLSIEEIKEDPEQLRDILSRSDLLAIHSSTDLLFKEIFPDETGKSESEIIRSETARRIKAYSSQGPNDFGWYSLDYISVNPSHETLVGLGEILIDPSIKEIEVIRDGVKIKGKRSVINGRICFADENGSYIATYTGDRYRIITNEELSEEDFNKNISTEKELRSNYEELFNSNQSRGINFDGTSNIDREIANMDPSKSPINEERVTGLIDKHNPPFSSEKILRVGRSACEKYNINYNIYKALILSESTFRWNAENPSTHATGLGQFLIPAWTDFAKYCQRMPESQAKELERESGINNIRDIFLNKNVNIRNDSDPRRNPILNAYATAWYMDVATKGILDRNAPIQDQAIIHALCHHDGPGGGRRYLEFLKEMRRRGANTQGKMRAEYLKNPNSFRLFDFQRTRGIDFHLSRYFSYAMTIAKNASGADQGSIEESRRRLLEQERTSPYDGNLREREIVNRRRTSPGTREIPYRHAQLTAELANGGCIGFTRGKEQSFSEETARTQLQWLQKNGVREIISLVYGDNIRRVIQINNLNIRVSSIAPLNTSTMTLSNESIVNKIANNINQGIKTYVHCRHGAHRAIISSALGFLNAGKTNSLDEAFNMAGGTLQSFYNRDYIPILEMAVKYAQDKGHSGPSTAVRGRIDQLRRS